MGIERLQKDYGIPIHWTAFPLHPDTPEEGLTIEELLAGRMKDIEGMMARLRHTARSLGLPFGDRKKSYNSRLAQELGKWAEAEGRGDEFHRAVFHAYFADGKNIAKKEALVELAGSVGLSSSEAQKVLDRRDFRGAVDSDWSRSYEMGVTAVPTFMMEGRFLVGAQSYERLEAFVKGSAEEKKDVP